MSGIQLETLMAAHEALMRVWDADYTKPLSGRLQHTCMTAAVGLRVELQALGLTVEVVAEPTPEPETEPMAYEQLQAVT